MSNMHELATKADLKQALDTMTLRLTLYAGLMLAFVLFITFLVTA